MTGRGKVCGAEGFGCVISETVVETASTYYEFEELKSTGGTLESAYDRNYVSIVL